MRRGHQRPGNKRGKTESCLVGDVSAGVSFADGTLAQILRQVNALEPTLQAESDKELGKRARALRYEAMAGKKLSKLMPEAYALVREAGSRALSMRHYDVQIVGGICLVRRLHRRNANWRRKNVDRDVAAVSCIHWWAKAPIWRPSTITWPSVMRNG